MLFNKSKKLPKQPKDKGFVGVSDRSAWPTGLAAWVVKRVKEARCVCICECVCVCVLRVGLSVTRGTVAVSLDSFQTQQCQRDTFPPTSVFLGVFSLSVSHSLSSPPSSISSAPLSSQSFLIYFFLSFYGFVFISPLFGLAPSCSLLVSLQEEGSVGGPSQSGNTAIIALWSL